MCVHRFQPVRSICPDPTINDINSLCARVWAAGSHHMIDVPLVTTSLKLCSTTFTASYPKQVPPAIPCLMETLEVISDIMGDILGVNS
jgi:hypothetical protein